MCVESFDVLGLDNKRKEYEVEQYLVGLPFVDKADADILSNSVTIDYDENTVDEDRVLDEIEWSGCKPDCRAKLFDRLRSKVGV